MVLEAQLAAAPVAWVTLANATFYPPDVAVLGVDLAALPVVRASDVSTMARAAEHLLRSDAFGLIVIDMGRAGDVALRAGALGRVVKLAQRHDAAVVCITKRSNGYGTLGSMVSLRAEALRLRGRDGDYATTLRALTESATVLDGLSQNVGAAPAGFQFSLERCSRSPPPRPCLIAARLGAYLARCARVPGRC